MKNWKKWLAGGLAAVAVWACAGTAAAKLAVTTTQLPDAFDWAYYSAQLEAAGGKEPYEWSLVGSDYAGSDYVASSYDGMAGDGTPQGWQADDECWDLALPFPFPFYGNTYTNAKINSNGTISFGNDDFLAYYYDEDAFKGTPMIAALWTDLRTDNGDIYVQRTVRWVAIRWSGSYLNGGEVNFMAVLEANGKITLKYGAGNADGGYTGISAGDREHWAKVQDCYVGREYANDYLYEPVLPYGFALSSSGELHGTPLATGSYSFQAVVQDSAWGTAAGPVTLDVRENPSLRPSLVSTTPAAGYVNLGTSASKRLAVNATHPAGGTLSYAWSVDGVAVEVTATNYTYRKTDTELHTVRCTVSAADLPQTAVAEWQVGVLTVSGPADEWISTGQRTVLRTAVTSSLPAEVTWYNANRMVMGTGDALVLANPTTTDYYHAEATSAMGTVTGRTAAVHVRVLPAVGRIYKLTGAPLIGHRLVLRAKAYGDLTDATWSWKRDGVEVSTKERLDIASLRPADFGTYTLTVTTSRGSATSEEYVLAPAANGRPVAWGQDRGDGRTAVPDGLTGVVQVTGGTDFSLALRRDGTVVAWGGNDHGGCDVPAGLAGVSRVVTSQEGGSVFAVKKDGRVAAWGRSYIVRTYWSDWAHEEYDPTTGEYSYTGDWVTYTNGYDVVGTMPAGLSNVVKIASGTYAEVALLADGQVVVWGEDVDMTTLPEGLSDVVDIAAGDGFALALTADGGVIHWGWKHREADDLEDIVSVSAAYSHGFALDGAGTLTAWGDDWNGNALLEVPGTDAGFIAVDAVGNNAMALDAAGNVAVWGATFFDQRDVPKYVQGAAIGIGIGHNHCLALVADTDGDTIPDVKEPRYGRDPAVWEPWTPTTVSGTVTVDGAAPSGRVQVTLLDAEGNVAGRTVADASGAWSIGGVLPGVYGVQVSAAGAVDTGAQSVSLLDGAAAELDFDLAPGEAPALAAVVPHLLPKGTECDENVCRNVALEDGWTVYLDLWPADAATNGIIDLGETAGRISDLDGTLLMGHSVTVKCPDDDVQTPAPDWLDGREGATVEANPHFTRADGAMRVVSTPSGAEVWVDCADAPLGVTPLEVTGLSALASHSHILLLKKDGYLRPRPIQFQVEPNSVTAISVPLVSATNRGMTVEVSSALPGMDIYLDYLPAGEVTPATVGGLDPASYSGDLWYSASHSVLLRHEGLRPFAPRAVPEERWFNQLERRWELVLDTALAITAPNTYDDSDGDGVRNDVEVEGGDDPFNPVSVFQRVTFDANGGTSTARMRLYEHGGKYNELPMAMRHGYAFLGWYTARDGGSRVKTTTSVSAAAERTLYAHWTDEQATSFKGNGGSPATTVVTNAIGAPYGEMPVPKLSGNALVGWFTKAAGGSEVKPADLVTEVAARTLYAHWTTNQVTSFLGNGGSPAEQKTTNVIYSAYGTLPSVKRLGQVFLGWFTAAEGGKQVYTNSTVTLAATRTLHAHWTDRQVTTFKGNGGSPSTQKTTNTIYEAYGALPEVKWSGHAFLGWFNQPEGGKRIYPNSTVTLAATRTLYAQWTTNQVTTFKGNGGTPATQKTTNAIYTCYGTLPEAAWENHVFLGWFTQPADGKRVYTNTTVTLAATRTLYAHWTDQQVTTFKGNGGNPDLVKTTNTIGTAYGTLPTPKKSGYAFLGWFTKASGGSKVTADDTVTVATARTLYAHWTDQQVTTFKGNGGTPATQATTNTIYADYGELPTANRSGQALVGWFTAPEGGKRVYPNSTVTLAATRTLYAHWTDQQVTTFKGNGGTPATQKTTNTIYSAYGALPTATWSGHVFQGWYNAAEGGKRVYTNSTVTLAATRTLYAHWITTRGFAITAIAVGTDEGDEGAVQRAVRSTEKAENVCRLRLELSEGTEYEIQWTASMDGEWETVERLTAETDGEVEVEIEVPGGEKGFFRLVAFVNALEAD